MTFKPSSKVSIETAHHSRAPFPSARLLVLVILFIVACGSDDAPTESTAETTSFDSLMSAIVAASSRDLPLPEVSRPVPHQQLTQNAPSPGRTP